MNTVWKYETVTRRMVRLVLEEPKRAADLSGAERVELVRYDVDGVDVDTISTDDISGNHLEFVARSSGLVLIVIDETYFPRGVAAYQYQFREVRAGGEEVVTYPYFGKEWFTVID